MRGRSAVEIMVIVFVFVIGITVVGAGATVAIVKIRYPNADVSEAVRSLTTVITAILAALLGLMAGKNEDLSSTRTRVHEQHETSVYERPDPHELKHKD